jgi:ABC-type glycerol-3-phosphate transport system permease component
MSPHLVVCLVAVAVNLAGVSMIYAMMSQIVAKLAWNGRGIFGGIAIILIAQLFWILPVTLVVTPRDPEGASAYALWFGNWIVTGFAVVLLFQKAKTIPRALEDSARMDGLGAFAAWRQVVFAFVGRELGLIALFTVMATLLPFWGFITEPNAGNSIVLFQRVTTLPQRLAMMIATSLIGALPLIGIFFAAKRRQ